MSYAVTKNPWGTVTVADNAFQYFCGCVDPGTGQLIWYTQQPITFPNIPDSFVVTASDGWASANETVSFGPYKNP